MKIRHAVLMTAMVTILNACGGGGGGGGGGGNTVASFQTSEFIASVALDLINAANVYSAGGTGNGVTVAVIDTGIDIGNTEFNGQIDANSIDIQGARSSLQDLDGHGTAVASLIGAAKNNAGIHGVAFDSQILAIRADVVGSCPADGGAGCSFSDVDLAAAIDHARVNGADVINLSLGSQILSSQVLINALAAATDAGIVVVAAAGNRVGGPVDDPASLASLAVMQGPNNTQGLLIGAGSLDANGNLSAFSSQPGAALQNFFISALGEDIPTVFIGGGLRDATGTSFSAALISGAVATLLDFFPNMTPEQIVARLYATAQDLGAAGVDPVTGFGAIDLAAAVAPAGTLSLQVSNGTLASNVDINRTSLSLSAAFGDALDGGNALGEVVALDILERAYTINLDGFVNTQSARLNVEDVIARGPAFKSLTTGTEDNLVRMTLADNSLAELPASMRRFNETQAQERDTQFRVTARIATGVDLTIANGMAPGQDLTYLDTPFSSSLNTSGVKGLYISEGGLALDYQASPNLTLRAEHSFGERELAQGGKASSSWSAIHGDYTYGDGTLRLTGGILDEDGTVLGSDLGLGGVGPDGALTAVAGISGVYYLTPSFSLSGRYERGLTTTKGGGNLIGKIDDLQSESFGLAATYKDLVGEDTLTLSVSQPLRVASGTADFNLSTGYDYATETASFTNRRLSLAPTGREVDVELGYATTLAEDTKLNLGVVHRTEPGHVKSAADELAAYMKLVFEW